MPVMKLTQKIEIVIGDCILVCLPETNMMLVGRVISTGELEGMKSVKIHLGVDDSVHSNKVVAH